MKIPMVSDTRRTISTDYGVLKEDEGIAYRWVLQCGVVGNFHESVNIRNYKVNIGADFEVSQLHFRGLFIIDPNGILRQITINDLPVGRSVEETLRLVQAFQFTDKHGEGEMY